MGQFFLHVRLEAAPGNKQPLVGVELGHGAQEFVDGRAINHSVAGFNLFSLIIGKKLLYINPLTMPGKKWNMPTVYPAQCCLLIYSQ